MQKHKGPFPYSSLHSHEDLQPFIGPLQNVNAMAALPLSWYGAALVTTLWEAFIRWSFKIILWWNKTSVKIGKINYNFYLW